jgi:hypothetical protein
VTTVRLTGDDVSYLNAGNIGIGTTTPTAKLDVAGDVEVSGDLDVSGGITIGTAQRYLTVSGFAFLPASPSLSYDRTQQKLQTHSAGSWYAEVNLPHGATVTELRCVVYDPDATYGTTVMLNEMLLNAGGGSAMGSVSSSGATGLQELVDSSASGTIDNEHYVYSLRAITGGTLQALHSVRIAYTVTEPLP